MTGLVLGQLPAQSTVFLYARYGSKVTFSGTPHG
jgi:hypothetical protein